MQSVITINAHSSIRIGNCFVEGKAKPKVIYFDPFKIEKEAHDADVIFFTHPHYDHFSPADFQKLAKEDTWYVCPASMVDEAVEAGIKRSRIKGVKPGAAVNVAGFYAEAVPAYNLKKAFHPKKNGWVGYNVNINDEWIYVMGDTDYIPEALTVTADIVIVPIGGTYTMNAREAAQLVNQLTPELAIPCHYGSIVGSVADATTFRQGLYHDIPMKALIK